MNEATQNTQTVTIPASQEHEGYIGNAIQVTLVWECPTHKVPRGEPYMGISYDGSRRLGAHRWENSCGCVDTYMLCREEAKTNGLNPRLSVRS